MTSNGLPPLSPNPESIPLREYHLPDPVSWWPHAIGWWLLALFLLLGLAMMFLFLRYLQNQKWRKYSLQHLHRLESSFKKEKDTHLLAKNISVLLRRVCLTRFPSQNGSHLSGESWLRFLDSCTSDDTSYFQTDIGRQLILSAYNPKADLDGDQLVKTCRRWLLSLHSNWWRSNA